MSLLKLIRQRLDDLQRLFAVRIALTIVLLAGAWGWFGAVWWKGSELRSDARLIIQALSTANLAKGDEVAVDFAKKGIVVVEGRTFGHAGLAKRAASLYDEDGSMRSAVQASRILLEEREPAWAPAFLLEQPETLLLLALASTAVLLLTVWTGLAVEFFATLALGVVVVLPLLLLGSWSWAMSLAGVVVLLYVFALLVRAAAIALGRSSPTFAVASNVLREAMRLRVATFFMGVLLIAIPLLPIWIDDKAVLRYQVQTFLSRGTGLLFFLAACMTVFLSCATVSFEIRDKQIWQLMTKPVARVQYLVGKWLGIVVLNVILLCVGAGAIFVYIEDLRTRPAADELDALAVRDEVLVARRGSTPDFRTLTADEARDLVDRKLQADSMLQADIKDGLRREQEVRRELSVEVHRDFLNQQRSIPAGTARSYTFGGLTPARNLNATLTLRYAFDIGSIDSHQTYPVIFHFTNGASILREFVPGQAHVLPLPPDVIDEKGNAVVEVFNGGATVNDKGEQVLIPNPGVMIFKPTSFEILYRVDSFESNFVRAMLVQLLKLSFLAMLGVCAGTVLSFPVATMLAFTILAIGSLSPFLGMSLSEYYVAKDAPVLWQIFQGAIKVVATAAEWLLGGFGEVRPNAMLVEGRAIPLSDLLQTVFMIGLVWTGGTFLLGYLAFRQKELAVYSGNA